MKYDWETELCSAGSVIFNEESVEGCFLASDTLLSKSPMERADILLDIIGDCEALRIEALKEMWK